MPIQGDRLRADKQEEIPKKPPARALAPALDALQERLQASPLSRREQEIALLVVHGLGNREIADRCAISEQTVKDHLKHTYRKLGVRSRTALVAELLGLNHRS